MKVAIHVDGPVIRGNERQAIRVAAGLRDRGHDVAVSCRAGGPVQAELEALGIRTTGIRPGGDADAWNFARFTAWLRRERPDAALMTSWKRAFIAGLAARAAGVPRALLRIGGYQPVPPGPRGWLERLALLRFYHGVVVISRGVGQFLRAQVPDLPEERIHVAHNGIAPREMEPAPLRAELGIPADARVLIAVGGAERVKGFDLLVEAAADAAPDAHLVLVGGGPEHLRDDLRRRAVKRGTQDRVHLLPWRPDVPALAAAADLFVLSSRTEGMSLAMLEAMAAGTPVVATDTGGVWEALAARDGRPLAGWIVEARNVDSLAAGMRRALDALRDDPAEVRARVDEARWRIDHWFTVERMVDAVEAALRG
ncbi:MAG TPA: glycosyltransferase [Longimicrobium sp.]|nr:glycosyltransferase [Longimicrobium sp.]